LYLLIYIASSRAVAFKEYLRFLILKVTCKPSNLSKWQTFRSWLEESPVAGWRKHVDANQRSLN